MADKLKVGVAGLHRGSSFIPAFTSIAETEVAAICDVDEETLETVADQYGIEKRFTEYEQMLDSVDIVALGTPEDMHVPQSVAALERNKHVICEVTAAVSLEQCHELVRAVRKSEGKYMMAENNCYWKPNVLIRNMVREGLFGEIYFAEGEYLHDIKFLHHDSDGNPTWRYYWQVGKNGCNYATHSLGPILQWFQERVVSLTCLGTERRTDPEHAMEDTVMMLCKTESGALIKIHIDMLSNRPANSYYSLQGLKGCFESDRGFGDKSKIWLADHSKDSEDWLPFSDFEKDFMPERWKTLPEEAQNIDFDLGEYFEMRDFVDSILNDTAPPIDVYTALDFTVPGLVSRESIANGGKPVEVPNFREIETD